MNFKLLPIYLVIIFLTLSCASNKEMAQLKKNYEATSNELLAYKAENMEMETEIASLRGDAVTELANNRKSPDSFVIVDDGDSIMLKLAHVNFADSNSSNLDEDYLKSSIARLLNVENLNDLVNQVSITSVNDYTFIQIDKAVNLPSIAQIDTWYHTSFNKSNTDLASTPR